MVSLYASIERIPRELLGNIDVRLQEQNRAAPVGAESPAARRRAEGGDGMPDHEPAADETAALRARIYALSAASLRISASLDLERHCQVESASGTVDG